MKRQPSSQKRTQKKFDNINYVYENILSVLERRGTHDRESIRTNKTLETFKVHKGEKTV